MNPIISTDVKEYIGRITDKELDKLKNSSVFVTGANGLLAKYTIYFLMGLNEYKNANIKIIALVRNKESAVKNFVCYTDSPLLSFVTQDICEPLSYDGDVDYIIHAAGSASAYAIVHDPVGIIKANTVGTINVLEYAKEKQVKNVLFLSTREIYGKVDSSITNIKETDTGILNPLEARSCYPESKRMAEGLLMAYYNQYNVPFTLARIAHCYGPGMKLENDGRVMADFIYFAVNNKDIVLNSDGSAIRSFCYISDAVDALIKIMVLGKCGEAYNLANETEPKMIRETAQILADSFPEKAINVTYKEASPEQKAGYNSYKLVQMDITKLYDLGWKPQISLNEGLKRTVNYFEEEKTK